MATNYTFIVVDSIANLHRLEEMFSRCGMHLRDRLLGLNLEWNIPLMILVSENEHKIEWNPFPYYEINGKWTVCKALYHASDIKIEQLRNILSIKVDDPVEMTVSEISKKLGIPNLKIVKE